MLPVSVLINLMTVVGQCVLFDSVMHTFVIGHLAVTCTVVGSMGNVMEILTCFFFV